MKLAIDRGRKTRPDIKLGICGEHGGEPASVKFCHDLGLTYVSCSPFRVPIARLAAAQAALANPALQSKYKNRAACGRGDQRARPRFVIKVAMKGWSLMLRKACINFSYVRG